MTMTNRQAALHIGDTIYRGKPCAHDHEAIRYTSNGACVECSKAAVIVRSQCAPREGQTDSRISDHATAARQARASAYREANREKLREKATAYRQADPCGNVRAYEQGRQAARQADRQRRDDDPLAGL